MKHVLTVLLGVIVVVFVWVSPSHAYLDPGTGSMIVQVVIGAVAAVSVSLGVFRRQVGSFFRRIFGRKSGGADQADDSVRQ